MSFFIAPVVEGHTEQQCLERLLHRIWRELLDRTERLQVLAPFRGKRDEFIHANGEALGAMVQKAHFDLLAKSRRIIDSRRLVLVLLDAEGDCPAELAPRLLQNATTAQANADIACVIAKRMFENWIAAGASTLAGINGMPQPLLPPDSIEDRSGVAWLGEQMRSVNPRRRYKKTIDALHFIKAFNVADCRVNSPSFRKLCRDLEKWAQP